MAVDRVVVQDQMEATQRRKLRLDETMEAQELLLAMTRVTLRNDIAFTDVQGRQAGRSYLGADTRR